MTVFSWGEYLGVSVSAEQERLKVSYKSAKRLKGNLTATDWDEELKKQITKEYSERIISCR